MDRATVPPTSLAGLISPTNRRRFVLPLMCFGTAMETLRTRATRICTGAELVSKTGILVCKPVVLLMDCVVCTYRVCGYIGIPFKPKFLWHQGWYASERGLLKTKWSRIDIRKMWITPIRSFPVSMHIMCRSKRADRMFLEIIM